MSETAASPNADFSVDTRGDGGTCSDTIASANTTASVKTINSIHGIDSIASDSIVNKQNVSPNKPISTEEAATPTTSDGNTSRTKTIKCSKAACFWPYIRIVLFIVVIIVLFLMCKLKITFACYWC